MPILVLYSSEKGSTAEIATRISNWIAEKLPPTEVRNIKDFDASTLENYTAVIIGSCVHGMRWLPEAIDFCNANKKALMSKPLIAFSVGAPNAMPKLFRKRWGRWEQNKIGKEIQKMFEGRLRMHTLLEGKLDKEGEPMFLRICCAPFGGINYGDLREWDKVEAFADAVVTNLKEDTVTPGGNDHEDLLYTEFHWP
ncbi:hypothetical protein CC78DRAFT_89229 [Lojkania enalia]|uniref:Flavodoxin-like domain-containing protein n=1 Tax=Lojkania enalia TaxID=147567 RepID=A0A9P4JXD2_9PLEO|nr:hypothetical protein CC78DRAFT_89229 [Didymosphaeria enalia]